jgi:hypothetical protein
VLCEPIRGRILWHYCPTVPEGDESVARPGPGSGSACALITFLLLTKLCLICLWRGSRTCAFGPGCWAASEDCRFGHPGRVPARKWQRERADTPIPCESGCGVLAAAASMRPAPTRPLAGPGGRCGLGRPIPSQLAAAAAGRFLRGRVDRRGAPRPVFSALRLLVRPRPCLAVAGCAGHGRQVRASNRRVCVTLRQPNANIPASEHSDSGSGRQPEVSIDCQAHNRQFQGSIRLGEFGSSRPNPVKNRRCATAA